MDKIVNDILNSNMLQPGCYYGDLIEKIKQCKTENDIICALIERWQSTVRGFDKDLPISVNNLFSAQFKKYDNRKLYKGITIQKDTLVENIIRGFHDNALYTSSTSNIECAKHFANTPTPNAYGIILEVEGDYLEINDYGEDLDLGEDEFILRRPINYKFKTIIMETDNRGNIVHKYVK